MKKRKAYRPKAVIQNPLVALQPVTAEFRAKVALRMHSALAMIETGKYPTPAEWADMADVVNVCDTAVKMGNLQADEVIPHVMAATEAMRDAAHRYTANGGMRLSGPGITAIRELLAVHEALLEGLTGMEVERIVAETRRIIYAIQKSGSHTVVSL